MRPLISTVVAPPTGPAYGLTLTRAVAVARVRELGRRELLAVERDAHPLRQRRDGGASADVKLVIVYRSTPMSEPLLSEVRAPTPSAQCGRGFQPGMIRLSTMG